MCHALRVDVVEKPRDVEEEEGSGVARQASGLDAVDKSGNCIYGVVFRVGSKLFHWDEAVFLNVSIESLGYYLFEELPHAFQEADGSVCFWQ